MICATSERAGCGGEGRRYEEDLKKIPGKKTKTKKTQEGRRRFIEGLEEDTTEENPTFKPADLPYFQNGADK
jgi:hypothetical protein